MDNAAAADTILDQLGGAGRLVAMTNAKNFVYDGASLAFKFSNRRGPNYCKIALAHDDTYTVTLGRIVKYDLRSSSTINGIFAGDLVELFENATGLRLSL